jgi:hypothetical protein
MEARAQGRISDHFAPPVTVAGSELELCCSTTSLRLSLGAVNAKMRLSMLIIFAGLSLSFLAYAALGSPLDTPSAYSKYPFRKYPVRKYKGKPAPPRLITPTQREFRTTIRGGARKGPNFAGHYTVVEWGCGSNCVVCAVVDAITGTVYDNDLPNPDDGYPCGLLYRRDSKLFVVEKSAAPTSECEPSFYIWEGSKFVPLQQGNATAGNLHSQ